MLTIPGNPNVEYHRSIAIPVIIAIGLTSLIIGVYMSRKAKEVGAIDFQNKVENDLKLKKYLKWYFLFLFIIKNICAYILWRIGNNYSIDA